MAKKIDEEASLAGEVVLLIDSWRSEACRGDTGVHYTSIADLVLVSALLALRHTNSDLRLITATCLGCCPSKSILVNVFRGARLGFFL